MASFPSSSFPLAILMPARLEAVSRYRNTDSSSAVCTAAKVDAVARRSMAWASWERIRM